MATTTSSALACLLLSACWSTSAVTPAAKPPAQALAPGDARVLFQNPHGGILALDGDRHRAHNRAEAIMQGHCAGAYEIQGEGLEAISVDDRIVNEWRVHYLCTNAP